VWHHITYITVSGAQILGAESPGDPSFVLWCLLFVDC